MSPLLPGCSSGKRHPGTEPAGVCRGRAGAWLEQESGDVPLPRAPGSGCLSALLNTPELLGAAVCGLAGLRLGIAACRLSAGPRLCSRLAGRCLLPGFPPAWVYLPGWF